jgi:hypothetical protein
MNTPGKSSSVGYSGTPLPAKLGLKPGMRFVALNAPPDLDVLLAGSPNLERLACVAPFECALAFVTTERALAAHFAKLAPKLVDVGMIWIAWPKKASGVATELTRYMSGAPGYRRASRRQGLCHRSDVVGLEIRAALARSASLRKRECASDSIGVVGPNSFGHAVSTRAACVVSQEPHELRATKESRGPRSTFALASAALLLAAARARRSRIPTPR